jgi:hypothetical protein
MQPEAVAAELPWLARFTAAPSEPGPAVTLAGIVDELAAGTHAPLGPQAPADALAAVADGIAVLADFPDQRWGRWARNVRWTFLRERLAAARSMAERDDVPAPWRRAARRREEQLRAALVDPYLLAPREALPASTPEEGVARGRVLVRETAGLLSGWIGLWSAAESLNLGGLGESLAA